MEDTANSLTVHIDRIELRRVIFEYFNAEELRTLFFELNLNYEASSGDGTQAKSLELVEQCTRNGRLQELAELVLNQRPNISRGSILPTSRANSPFKGLQFFDEADAHLFFGRQKITQLLVNHLSTQNRNGTKTNNRFWAIVGASGSGKSSLARAGVVPALRQQTKWQIRVFTPTDEPLKQLALTLSDNAAVTDIASLQQDFAGTPRALDLHIHKMFNDPSHDESNHLLLVIDQFEELFTLCKDEDKQKAFIDNLITAVSSTNSPLSILITLRADFYIHCADFSNLRQLLSENQTFIGSMDNNEVREVIEKPTERHNLQFEKGLVDLLLKDVGAENGKQPEPGALPLLSHALQETWRRRDGHTLTFVGYYASGGVHKAIAQTAKDTFEALDNEEKKIACEIFLSLTELGEGTQDTRRRATLQELYSAHENKEAVKLVLEKLAEVRLIIIEKETVEVAHEALIREWDTLHQWLEENRERLQIPRRLAVAATIWEEHDHDPEQLYRGARLAEVQEWAAQYGARLTPLDNEFLTASQAAANEEIRRKEARQQRELEQAQALAEAEQHKNKQLRLFVIIASTLFLLATVLAIVAFFQKTAADEATVDAENAHQEALTNATEAETAREEAEKQEEITLFRKLAIGAQNYKVDQLDLSLLLGVEANQLMAAIQAQYPDAISESDQVEVASSLLAGLLYSPYLNSYFQDETASFINTVAVSSDQDDQIVASGGSAGEIILWQNDNPEPMLIIDNAHEHDISSLTFNHNSTLLASAGCNLFNIKTQACEEFAIDLWQIPSGEHVKTLTSPSIREKINALTFSPDDSLLASGGNDDVILLWNLDNLEQLGTPFIGHSDNVNALAFNHDGTQLASGSNDNSTILWDVASGENTALLPDEPQHSNSVRSLAFDPSGRWLASGGNDDTIIIWDLKPEDTEQAIGRKIRMERDVIDLAFTAEGELVAAGMIRRTVKLWKIKNNNTIIDSNIPLEGHASRVLSLAFNDDGSMLASGATDKTTILWDIFSQQSPIMSILEKTGEATEAITFDSTGNHIASGGCYQTTDKNKCILGQVNVWDYDRKTLLFEATAHAGATTAVAFNNNNTLFASAGCNMINEENGGCARGEIVLWDASNGEKLNTLFDERMLKNINSIAFHPNKEEILASGSEDGYVWLWDVNTGEIIKEFSFYNQSVINEVAFNLDGHILATGGNDKIIRLWDTETGQLIYQEELSDIIRALSFSPDSQLLAVGTSNGITHLWDVRNNLPQPAGKPLTAHDCCGVTDVAFSADSKILGTSGDDENIVLWDVATHQPIALIQSHGADANSIAFHPQSNELVMVSGGDDKEVFLFSTAWDDLETYACNLVKRNLTWQEWHLQISNQLPYEKSCTNNRIHASVMDVGEKLTKVGEFEEAKSHLEWILTIEPNLNFDPEVKIGQFIAKNLIDEGTQLAKDGDIESAVDIFNEALVHDPTLNFEPAIEAKRLAVTHLLIQGLALQHSKVYSEAITKFEEVIELDSEYAEAHYQLGRSLDLYRNSSDEFTVELQKIIEYYKSAVALDNLQPEYYEKLGDAYFDNKDYDEAIESFNNAIALNPPNKSYLYRRRCIAYRSLGEEDELNAALEDCTEAIRLSPEYPYNYYYRGRVFEAQQKAANAISDYEVGLQLFLEQNPESESGWPQTFRDRIAALQEQGE